MKGLVTKSTGSWYSIKVDGNYYEARLRGKFKLVDKKITNPIAVGDVVQLEKIENDFVITELVERENYVIRTSPKKKGHSHILAANVDQAMVIASHKLPRTSLGFIDRFLVTLEAFRIPGYVVFNKKDLYTDKEMVQIEDILTMYRKIGYDGGIYSFADGEVGEVKSWMKNKMTLLAGHSGTGKSTLINQITPYAKQDVREVSTFANKGVHTTTFAEMFDIGGEGHIIDTPGIKELGLAEIERKELSHYFPEMRSLLGQCKYHNCIHFNEPGCVIQEAVRNEEIDIRRFESYLSMLVGEDNRR